MKKIKTYLDFISETHKTDLDETSIPIEIEEDQVENEDESEEENSAENQ